MSDQAVAPEHFCRGGHLPIAAQAELDRRPWVGPNTSVKGRHLGPQFTIHCKFLKLSWSWSSYEFEFSSRTCLISTTRSTSKQRNSTPRTRTNSRPRCGSMCRRTRGDNPVLVGEWASERFQDECVITKQHYRRQKTGELNATVTIRDSHQQKQSNSIFVFDFII